MTDPKPTQGSAQDQRDSEAPYAYEITYADHDCELVYAAWLDKYVSGEEEADILWRKPLYARPAPEALGDATWQPIETAPKDGTAVLVVLPDSDIPYAARFDAECGNWRHCWDNYRLRNLDAPTHWMPLPPALSAQRAANTAAIAADGAGNGDEVRA